MQSINLRFTAYFDGSCEPINPGGVAAYGAIIYDYSDQVWSQSGTFSPNHHIPNTSNNVAEYCGLISILDWFITKNLTTEPIIIYGDSKLVISQLFGSWKIKKGLYTPLAYEAREKLIHFTRCLGLWIPREKNTLADQLSRLKTLR